MDNINLHPFSIASLTSPSRPRKPSPMLHLAAVPDLPKLTLPQPSPSPDLGTGSRECSPEKPLNIHTDHGRLGTPSPVGSVDSGHSSPNHSLTSLDVPTQIKTETKQVKRVPVTESDSDKPPHSYIALISMAIMASPEKKLVLCDIYQFIMDTFPYYNNSDRAWRNSIRHNLSLNECFIKAGRADNGKGNYWAVHPSCTDDFAKGDFRRRQARRRARTRAASPYADRGPTTVYQPPALPGYIPMTTTSISSFHPYLAAAGLPFINPGATAGMFQGIPASHLPLSPQSPTPASMYSHNASVSPPAVSPSLAQAMYSAAYPSHYYGQMPYAPY